MENLYTDPIKLSSPGPIAGSIVLAHEHITPIKWLYADLHWDQNSLELINSKLAEIDGDSDSEH